jgi:hypothetical protein
VDLQRDGAAIASSSATSSAPIEWALRSGWTSSRRFSTPAASTGPTAGWDAEEKEGCERMSSLAGEPRDKKQGHVI